MNLKLHVLKPALRLALLSVLGGWLLGVAALFMPLWQAVELKVFDVLSVLTAPKKSSLPITIIGIDEASFTQLGVRWPWPRDMHARLIDRLSKSGAAVIAFDVLFSESGLPAEDDALARAIANAGNVVLTSDHVYHETAASRQWLRVDPVATFTQAGAVAGLATMTLDGDAVARRVSNQDDAFWRESIRTLIRSRPGSVPEPYVPPGALMRHIGPAHTYPYVSYYQVINGDPSIPSDFFADQIVLIGRDVRASLDSGGAQADTFATPFLMGTGLMTPGVEIHATQIENALMGNALMPASRGQNLLGVSVVILLTLPLLVFWNPLRTTLLTLVLGSGVMGVSMWLFANHNLWVATATPLLALAVAFLGSFGGAYFTEQRRASAIRSAFTRYVSADVVAEMIAHPELLKLGGQRRDISVLFSDLAGFTSLSEKLSAEAVGQLINLYLNAMTHVVMANKGTVDKFIGDAVMAFWGAPLNDDEHALHATQAAMAMQAAMHDLQPQFEALGVENLVMRIGVNSGPAIIGNMGSDLRFDYTAIGDTVNLAARLEGVNKAYGTRILLGSQTATLLQGRIPLRPVDRVRVKGKYVPVDISTPCPDEVLQELTAKAWEAYVRRDWQAARAAWQELRLHAPDDPLIAVFEKRISLHQAEPPPADWDGSIALEKL